MKRKLTSLIMALCVIAATMLPAAEAHATSLDKTKTSVKIGKTTSVNIINNTQGSVAWSVEDGSILDIVGQDAGHAEVRGKKIGTTDLIAETDWWTYRCEITVIKPKKRVVYKEDGVTVTVTGATIDDYDNGQILLNIKNNTGKTISVWADDVSLNGKMMNDDIVCSVAPKKQANDEIECYSSYMNKNKIKDIKSAGFKLEIRNKNLDILSTSKHIKVKF